MKVIKILCFYSTIVISIFLVTNGIVKINKENRSYQILIEENKRLSFLQEKECVEHYGVEFCDSTKSNWKCREIKSLAFSLAELDKADPRERLSYINNHHMLINKYNTECLVEK